MASNKFEEDIKEKLEGRSIMPTPNAWIKLSSSLDEQKETKNNKQYWLLGLAASIVGVLLVASQFLNNQARIEDLPKVVDSPEVIIQDSNNVIAKEIPKEGKSEENKIIIEFDKNKNQINKKAREFIEDKTIGNVVAVSSNQEGDVIEKDIKKAEFLKEKPSFEEQKIQDIVAQVHVLKEAKTEVTDADINALLLQAQQEIRLNKVLNKTTGLVDSNALLQEVEGELDQSFREKVFKAIRASYDSVKTAVAQRND